MIKNDSIKTSAMYVGYLILKGIKKLNKDKISLYEISDILKKHNIKSNRQLIIGLTFLYSVDIVEFAEAYVCIKK